MPYMHPNQKNVKINLTVLQYADNLVLCDTAASLDIAIKKMQTALTALQEILLSLVLYVNIEKTAFCSQES